MTKKAKAAWMALGVAIALPALVSIWIDGINKARGAFAGRERRPAPVYPASGISPLTSQGYTRRPGGAFRSTVQLHAEGGKGNPGMWTWSGCECEALDTCTPRCRRIEKRGSGTIPMVFEWSVWPDGSVSWGRRAPTLAELTHWVSREGR